MIKIGKWQIVQKIGERHTLIQLRQKYTVENIGRSTLRRYHQNKTTVQCSKLGEKILEEPALEPKMADLKVQ